MRTCNLAFLGFGNVGQAFARLLVRKTVELRERCGLEWRLTGVSTQRYGWLAEKGGLNVEELLAKAAERKIQKPQPKGQNPYLALRDWLADSQPDVVVEVTPLNHQTGQPAIGHIRAALEYGAHVITANKGPVVFAYQELRDLAAAKGKRFLFESTVMDGAPVFSLFRESLPLANLRRIRGVLNSTTNFILTKMEAGRGFEEAVEEARAISIAETNAALDLEGWDAAVKVAALVTVLMDFPLKPGDVQRQGIGELRTTAVRAARAEGKPYKLVCQAERKGKQVVASVRPEQLPLTDPLASVSGTTSIVHFETDVLPGLTITEHDPTPETTAYGLLADLINATKGEAEAGTGIDTLQFSSAG